MSRGEVGHRRATRGARITLAACVVLTTAACGTLLSIDDETMPLPEGGSAESGSADAPGVGNDALSSADAAPDALGDAKGGFDAAMETKVVFVTGLTTQGDMRFGGGGIALGRVAADTECEKEAAAAGLSTGAIAWLSTNASAAIDRLPDAGVRWARPDGGVVFDDTAYLRAGQPPHVPIDQLATGQVVTMSVGAQVWTGTTAIGAPRGPASERCSDWTTNTGGGGISGWVGLLGDTSSNWTAYSAQQLCDGDRSVICFQK